MRVDVSPKAIEAGFANEPIGTHTSKTMMLDELRALLTAAPGPRRYDGYVAAAINDNALQKKTSATRAKTLGMLRQLYALRPNVPVFAALRALWTVDPAGQPMIALLCAMARDPLLRSTADLVLALDPGSTVSPSEIGAEVGRSFPNRYAPGVLHHIGQNVAASWKQAGLLQGRRTKHRSHPALALPGVVYAMYLGHLDGLAGPALFESLWARTFDVDRASLRTIAERAGRAGWLDYAAAGGMTEIGFRHLDELIGQEAA